MKSPQFGGKVRKKDLERFSQSPYWNGKKFENLIPTSIDITFSSLPGLIRDNLKGRNARDPDNNIEVHRFRRDQLDDELSFVWYGHSSLMLRIDGNTLLIDPMLGPNASPIGPFDTIRFSKRIDSVFGQLPEIDGVLITHDHYDHLDFQSIMRLKAKVDKWYVALGISRHLEQWGIDPEAIVEFDWWESRQLDNLNITFTPSRHFAGRGLFDRAKSFWGGWVVESRHRKVYWSGDGGYGPHFEDVGARLGPFDLAFMECGQYNYRWHAIHMYPEESVKAANDAKARVAVPVHWGAFTLALHHWKDPIERFCHAIENSDVIPLTPQIGQVTTLQDAGAVNPWWHEVH